MKVGRRYAQTRRGVVKIEGGGNVGGERSLSERVGDQGRGRAGAGQGQGRGSRMMANAGGRCVCMEETDAAIKLTYADVS
jgi:hypothetical protein